MNRNSKSLSKADRCAQLAAFFSDYIQSMPSYTINSPDPELVAWQHPDLVLTETPRLSGAEGYLNPLSEGRVLTDTPSLLPKVNAIREGKAGAFELNVRSAAAEDTYAIVSRRRFTLAHEMGHYCLEKNAADIFRILGITRWASHGDVENVCHLFASIFLIPCSALVEKAEFFSTLHPQDALRRLCRHFHVNVETMIRRLAFTGVLQEYNWFIGFFGYSLNPTKKREGRKWRLQPDRICLPRGLSAASKGVNGSTVIYINHSHYHTGMETLRLCHPEWAFIPDWLEVYGKFQQAEANQNANQPWGDLNQPELDSRLRRNMLRLRTRSLSLSAKSGALPFPAGLFLKGDDIPDMKWHPQNFWKDESWILSAQDIRIQGSRFEHNNDQMVLCARLSLKRRHKEW